MTKYRQSVLLLAIILSTILPLTKMPKFQAYIIILCVYLFAVVFLLRMTTTLYLNKTVISLLFVIWCIFLLHLFRPSSQIAAAASLQRVPIFSLAIVVNIFLLPRITKFWNFAHIVVGIGGIITLIGLPTLVGMNLDLGLLSVAPSENIFYSPPLISRRIPVLNSVFVDSNFMGEFMMVATVCAVALVDRYRSRATIGLLLLNGLGLYLTQSRATIAATVLGVSVIVAFHSLNRYGFYLFTIVGGVVGLVAAPIVLGIIPGPSFIPTPDLSGRIELWHAAVEAFHQRPLVGYGAGNTIEPLREHVVSRLAGTATHNSYVRMFVTTGIFGGTAYVGLVLYVLFRQLVNLQSKASVAIAGLLVATMVDQFFLSFTIFGISSPSVIASLVIGYSLKNTGIVNSSLYTRTQQYLL